MAILSKPTLQVDILTGSGMARITTTVNVQVHPTDWLIPGYGFPSITLKANIMGEDGYLDDNLLSFSNRQVTSSGLYTFSKTVPITWLNEDAIGKDEIYTKFNVVNHTNPQSPFGPKQINSNFVTGEFGW
jgi:hypothetical protein